MCFAYHQPVWLYVCMCMCVPRMSKCLGRLLMMSDVIPLRGALVVEVALLIGFRLLLVRARVTVATLAHRAASVGADGGRGSRTGAAWRGARASAPLGRGSRVSRDVAPVGGELPPGVLLRLVCWECSASARGRCRSVFCAPSCGVVSDYLL